MSLPHFFVEDLPASGTIVLDEENSRHIVQVLRMKTGEQVRLLNGKGVALIAEIADVHKKHCAVNIGESFTEPAPGKRITVAISLLKNVSRFEWFLEKATEIGVTTIVPLICARTEGHKFRMARMQTILVSAMLQSQRLWLSEISEPVTFRKFALEEKQDTKFIAHCRNGEVRNPIENYHPQHAVIMIGPEGDFTPEEIELAIQNNFQPVSLGAYRLRTETAGIVAATLLCAG